MQDCRLAGIAVVGVLKLDLKHPVVGQLNGLAGGVASQGDASHEIAGVDGDVPDRQASGIVRHAGRKVECDFLGHWCAPPDGGQQKSPGA
jgi:hypothetical protein